MALVKGEARRDVVTHLDIGGRQDALVEDLNTVADGTTSGDGVGLTRLQGLAQGKVHTARLIDADVSIVAVVFVKVGIVQLVILHESVVVARGVGNAVDIGRCIAVDILGRADFCDVHDGCPLCRAVIHTEGDGQLHAGTRGQGEGGAEAASGGAIAVINPVAVLEGQTSRDVVGDLDGLGGNGSLVEDLNGVVNQVANVDCRTLVQRQRFAQGKIEGAGRCHREAGEVGIVLVGVFSIHCVIGGWTVVAGNVVHRAIGIGDGVTFVIRGGTDLSAVDDGGVGWRGGIESCRERQNNALARLNDLRDSDCDLAWQGGDPIWIFQCQVARQVVSYDDVLGRHGPLVEDFECEVNHGVACDGAALTLGQHLAQGEVEDLRRIDTDDGLIVVILISLFVVDRVIHERTVVGRVRIGGAINIDAGYPSEVLEVADLCIVRQINRSGDGVGNLQGDVDLGAAACCDWIGQRRGGHGGGDAGPLVIGQGHACGDVIDQLDVFGCVCTLVEYFQGEDDGITWVHAGGLTYGQCFAQGQIPGAGWHDGDGRAIVVVLIGVFVVDLVIEDHAVVSGVFVRSAVNICDDGTIGIVGFEDLCVVGQITRELAGSDGEGDGGGAGVTRLDFVV